MANNKYYIPVDQFKINNLYEKQTDDKLSFDRLVKDLKIKVYSLTETFINFEVKGADISLIQCIKKAAWGDVPTMALDHIEVIKNTSVIPDEILMEQLGFVTFMINPKLFNFKKRDEEYSIENSVTFNFSAKNVKENGGRVCSNLFKWVPIEGQTFPRGQEPKVLYPDQLLILLDQKHELSFKGYCVKGVGNTSSKFSPCPYSNCVMAPVIKLKKQFQDEEARKLQALLPQGVIDIKNVNGVDVAVISKPKNYVHNRNVLMNEQHGKDVELYLDRQHIIMTFEGTGVIHPKDFITEALEVMMKKCQDVMAGLNDL